MRTLTEEQFQEEAEPLLKEMFIDYSIDNIHLFFSYRIPIRTIIYPCSGSFDKAIPVDILVAAATVIGDTGCYISNLWKSVEEPNHCFINLSELLVGYSENMGNEAQIIGLNLGMDIYNLECIIYSAKGKWAIRMNHEGYGLLGCSPDFMAVIKSGVPNLNEQVHRFFERYHDWSMKPNLSWIPSLLQHAYGTEMAEVLIAASNLDMEYNPYSS